MKFLIEKENCYATLRLNKIPFTQIMLLSIKCTKNPAFYHVLKRISERKSTEKISLRVSREKSVSPQIDIPDNRVAGLRKLTQEGPKVTNPWQNIWIQRLD